MTSQRRSYRVWRAVEEEILERARRLELPVPAIAFLLDRSEASIAQKIRHSDEAMVELIERAVPDRERDTRAQLDPRMRPARPLAAFQDPLELAARLVEDLRDSSWPRRRSASSRKPS